MTSMNTASEPNADVSIGAVAAVLWRAKIFIVASGLMGGAFVVISTRPAAPLYHGRALLMRRDVGPAQPAGTLAHIPPAGQGGLEVRIPTGTAAPYPPLDINTINTLRELVGSSGVIARIANELHAPSDADRCRFGE